MRPIGLLKKKALPSNLFSPRSPLSLNDDIALHAAFIHNAILVYPYQNTTRREHHGIAHVARVAFYIPLLNTFYNQYLDTNLSDEDIKLLQLAGLFHDAGREGDGEDLWDNDSAALLYYYLTITLKLPHEKAVIFSEAIANKDYAPSKTYHHLIINNGKVSWDSKITVKEKTIAQSILHDADCFDIIRARHHFDKNYLDFYKMVAKKDIIAHDEMLRFSIEVKQLINLMNSSKNANTEFCFGIIYRLISSISEFPLFQKCYGAEKFSRDIKLSITAHKLLLPFIDSKMEPHVTSLLGNIEFPLELSLIKAFTNRYRLDGQEALFNFLVSTQFKTIKEIIEVEKQSLKKTLGRLFKTILNAENNWPDVAKSLLNLASHRPELRIKGDRKKFTPRLWGSCYIAFPTNKTEKIKFRETLTSEYAVKKLDYTRPQSMSNSNPAINYNPAPFQGISPQPNEPLVGISLSPADCHITRIMMYDPGKATYFRGYDADTIEAAEKYATDNFFNDLSHIQLHAQVNLVKQSNEVIAGYHWNSNGSSHITIFKRNHLESNLLAQLRALDLYHRFGKAFSIPISFYPDYHLYDKEEQDADIHSAKDSSLRHYLLAMDFLNGDQIIFSEQINVLRKVNNLLKKINPEKANSFSISLEDFMREKTKQFCSIKTSDPLFSWVKSKELSDLVEHARHNTLTDEAFMHLTFLWRCQSNPEKSNWENTLNQNDIESMLILSNEDVYATSQPKIPTLTHSFSDLVATLSQISEKKTQLISFIVRNKISAIKTVSDAFELAKYLAEKSISLSPSKTFNLNQNLNDNLIYIFNCFNFKELIEIVTRLDTLKEFINTLQFISLKNRTLLCRASVISNFIADKTIHNRNDLAERYKNRSESNTQEYEEIISRLCHTKKILTLVSSCDDSLISGIQFSRETFALIRETLSEGLIAAETLYRNAIEEEYITDSAAIKIVP
ncbi:MAG: SidE phosphodiesterase domain-containing protein [Gammaproteobacteria bacterium]|nr:SidE phosphodiesterase domain-containing protein [Gammaproteobacteria bacterium]